MNMRRRYYNFKVCYKTTIYELPKISFCNKPSNCNKHFNFYFIRFNQFYHDLWDQQITHKSILFLINLTVYWILNIAHLLHFNSSASVIKKYKLIVFKNGLGITSRTHRSWQSWLKSNEIKSCYNLTAYYKTALYIVYQIKNQKLYMSVLCGLYVKIYSNSLGFELRNIFYY